MRTKDHEGACATRDRGFPLLTFAVLDHRPDLSFAASRLNVGVESDFAH